MFTPPADGDYVSAYPRPEQQGRANRRSTTSRPTGRMPDFTLRCDPDKAMIGPGTSTAWYVHVNRLNGFTGPVKVEVKGLPKEVTASPLTIPPTMTQGVIVLTAAAERLIDGGQRRTRRHRQGQDAGRQGRDAGARRHAESGDLLARRRPGQFRRQPADGGGHVAFGHSQGRGQHEHHYAEAGRGGQDRGDVQRRGDYDKGVSLDVLLQHLGSVFGNPLPPGVTIVPARARRCWATAARDSSR